MSVSAYDFEVDGIYYNITSDTDKTAEVTYKGISYTEYDEYFGVVTIPEFVTYCGNTYSVTGIGNYAFYGCYDLNTVEIGKSVTSIGRMSFASCSNLTSVEIPNSVTSIGDYAFSSCTGLTFIEIPNSVISIGNQTFIGCSGLNIVEIGNSVTRIGEYAFYDCENLTKLISYAEVPPVCGNSVFYGVKKDFCVLQIPQSCLSAYQQADQWKEFFFIEDVLTAIGGVTVDGAVPATADVYSTNGMLIKRNAELKNLKHELPAGIYVIGGKKVYVK